VESAFTRSSWYLPPKITFEAAYVPQYPDCLRMISLADVVKMPGEFEPDEQATGGSHRNSGRMNHLPSNEGQQTFPTDV
jgi:hypothetical protein